MFALGIFVILLYSFLIGVAFIHRAMDERFPRYIFWFLMSWWWPDKKEDVASIVADLLDSDLNCSQWTNSRWSGFQEKSGRYGFDIPTFSGRASVSVKIPSTLYETIEASDWGDFRLWRASEEWKSRRDRSKNSIQNIEKKQKANRALELIREELKK